VTFDTKQALEKLKALAADENPATSISGAALFDPEAELIMCRIMAELETRIREKRQSGALMMLMMAGLGYLQGSVIDTSTPGAGQAVEHFTEALVKAFRFSVDAGFAYARKEQAGD
jgi:hypothetical protein